MKFWTKLFSRCGVLFLIAFPISVNSQIVTSLNAHQEAELGTEIVQGVYASHFSHERVDLPLHKRLHPLEIKPSIDGVDDGT